MVVVCACQWHKEKYEKSHLVKLKREIKLPGVVVYFCNLTSWKHQLGCLGGTRGSEVEFKKGKNRSKSV